MRASRRRWVRSDWPPKPWPEGSLSYPRSRCRHRSCASRRISGAVEANRGGSGRTPRHQVCCVSLSRSCCAVSHSQTRASLKKLCLSINARSRRSIGVQKYQKAASFTLPTAMRPIIGRRAAWRQLPKAAVSSSLDCPRTPTPFALRCILLALRAARRVRSMPMISISSQEGLRQDPGRDRHPGPDQNRLDTMSRKMPAVSLPPRRAPPSKSIDQLGGKTKRLPTVTWN